MLLRYRLRDISSLYSKEPGCKILFILERYQGLTTD